MPAIVVREYIENLLEVSRWSRGKIIIVPTGNHSGGFIIQKIIGDLAIQKINLLNFIADIKTAFASNLIIPT